jgi:hypothetical protein
MKFKINYSYAMMVHEEHIVDLTEEGADDGLAEDLKDRGYSTVAAWVTSEPFAFIGPDTKIHQVTGDNVGDYGTIEVKEISPLEQLADCANKES